jgi:hypothetical protein
VNIYERSAQRVSIAFVLAVVLALLVSQTALPAPLSPVSWHSTVRCLTSHAKLQYLDESSLWVRPSQSFQLSTPPASLSPWIASGEPLLPLESKGFHYNRPPPFS